jgi:hypothetical protein
MTRACRSFTPIFTHGKYTLAKRKHHNQLEPLGRMRMTNND